MMFIGLAAVLAAVDLLIKYVIEQQKSEDFPRELERSRGMIRLHKNHNQGFPFGFLERNQEIVRLLPLALTSALLGILFWLIPRKGFFPEKLAFSVILGGAVSNLYDRLVRHYVVDYFSIEWGQLKKVVFNLGDIFIFLGSGVSVVIEMARSWKK